MAASRRAILMVILFGCCLLGCRAQEKSITVERGVSVRMRDGVLLAEGETTLACVDREGKVQALPAIFNGDLV